jgi:hypothetical protein
LSVSDYRFDRLENLFGEVRIEFADFRYILDEVCVSRLECLTEKEVGDFKGL